MVGKRNSIIKYVEKLNIYEIMDLSEGSGTYFKIS